MRADVRTCGNCGAPLLGNDDKNGMSGVSNPWKLGGVEAQARQNERNNLPLVTPIRRQ